MNLDPRLAIELHAILRAMMRPLLGRERDVTIEHVETCATNGVTLIVAQFELRRIEEPTDPLRKVRRRRGRVV